MKTILTVLLILIAACATDPLTGIRSQNLYIETVCDPISGECHEEVTSALPGGSNSVFTCTYGDTRPECGFYLGYMSDGTGTANSYLSLDTLEAAATDPFYDESRGYSMTCAVTLDTMNYNMGVAQCTLTQGPRHWRCTVFKGDASSFCCPGSAGC